MNKPRIEKYDLDTLETIESYSTIAIAARKNKADKSTIRKVCIGERKKAYKFGWRYTEKKN